MEASTLVGRAWRSSRLGRLRLLPAAKLDLGVIDKQWPQLRAEGSESAGWPAWSTIFHYPNTEGFGLVDDANQAIVLWAGTYPKKVSPGIVAYRLHFIETHPSYLRRGYGRLAWLIIGKRALEAGTNAVILLAAKSKAAFYEDVGGEQRAPAGWDPNMKNNELPFTFDENTLKLLAGAADVIEEET